MRAVTQFLSTLGARATHVVAPGDSRIRRRVLAPAVATVTALALIVLAPGIVAKERRDDDRWVGTWSASPQAVAPSIHLNGQTVRQIVHTSLGGDRVRVRFSNVYGTSGLVIGSAHVALSTGGA